LLSRMAEFSPVKITRFASTVLMNISRLVFEDAQCGRSPDRPRLRR
jgi:hypothetical protein